MCTQVLLAALVLAATTQANEDHGFEEHRVQVSDVSGEVRSSRYRLLAPPEVEPGERYPLVLFLHGAGERGNDNLLQLTHFPERMAQPAYRARFPCFVLAPQCPQGGRWSEVDWGERESTRMPQTISQPLHAAVVALEQVLGAYPVDGDRVYLTGLSMGGFGAWELAARMPERFAAVVPICGGGDEQVAARIAHLPIWAWHGDRDGVVPPIRSRRMVEALRAAGGFPWYTELPGVGHGSWVRAYDPDGVLPWMWKQRRGATRVERVMACEQASGRLLLFDAYRDWNEDDSVLWSWDPEQAPGLPPECANWFAFPTDAKPSMGGSRVWTCASGGGVAKVRLADGRVEFHARPGGNPHSVAELPGGLVVVASSTGGHLRLYDTEKVSAPVEPLCEVPLAGAHGVEWDADRRKLWALGDDELVSLTWDAESRSLVPAERHALPALRDGSEPAGPGGHDLSPLPGADGFLLSDRLHLWVFDAERLEFEPFAPLHRAPAVKSISRRREGGPTLILQATEDWWSDRGVVVGTERTFHREGAKFYKLRWW